MGGLPLNTALALNRRAKARKSKLFFRCPGCGFSLTLHQPDPELADRLLATCEECKSWYLTNPSGTEWSPIGQSKGRPRLL
jgi:hypothetical protein